MYSAKYESECNLFYGRVSIEAGSIAEAQDKFFAWLKKQDVYPHMWKISVEFEKCNDDGVIR